MDNTSTNFSQTSSQPPKVVSPQTKEENRTSPAVATSFQPGNSAGKRQNTIMSATRSAPTIPRALRKVRFLSPGREDPRVQVEIDIPPQEVTGLDTPSYNDVARTVLIRDRGHHINMSTEERRRLKILGKRFTWLKLSHDYRSEVLLGRAMQGQVSPEDLLSLVDPTFMPPLSVPRTRYYWGSKDGGSPNFHRVDMSHRELNDRILKVLTDPAQFIMAWTVLTECMVTKYCPNDNASLFNTLAAANWYLIHVLTISDENSWALALEYHLIVHRKRMGLGRPFNPKDWNHKVDDEAFVQALLLTEERERTSHP